MKIKFRRYIGYLTESIDLPCKNTYSSNPGGYEYDCDYENAGYISCDDCVCNYGMYSPQTGKKINWFFRIIQQNRSKKYYKQLLEWESRMMEKQKIEFYLEEEYLCSLISKKK